MESILFRAWHPVLVVLFLIVYGVVVRMLTEERDET